MDAPKNRGMAPHIDAWDLLAFRYWDLDGPDAFEGGDAAHREGMLAAGMTWALPLFYKTTKLVFNENIKKLQHSTKKGLWRRHPDETKWYGDWEHMSRDQATMIVIAMSALEMHKELDQFFWHLFLRGSFMTNWLNNGDDPVRKRWWKRDWCGPDFWGIWVRHKMKYTKWGARCLGHFLKFINWFDYLDAQAKVHSYAEADPDNADDSNFIATRVHAQLTWPEAGEEKARHYYFYNRPFASDPNLIEYEVNNGPMSAMRRYFDGAVKTDSGYGASPPLDRLWEPLVNAMGE